MSTTTVQLEQATLLRDRDGLVLSFRHRCLDAMTHEAMIAQAEGQNVGQAVEALIMRRVQSGELEVVGPPEYLPSVRTCFGCGCTDDFSCAGGCSWVSEALCSTCATAPMRSRKEIEAHINAALGCLPHDNHGAETLAHLLSINIELQLDIRSLLTATLVAPSIDELAASGGAPPGLFVPAGGSRIVRAGAEILT